MFDTNLLFISAATITTSSSTPPSIDVGKTPADGIGVEVCVTTLTGSATGLTLDFTVQECDTTNGTWTTVCTIPQFTGTGRNYRVAQSKRRYLRLAYVAGAATGLSSTVTAGIVSGPQRDHTA